MGKQAGMLKLTRNFIRDLLRTEVECRKNRMMDCINNGFPAVEERIKSYQEAYAALQDFYEWDEDQEG